MTPYDPPQGMADFVRTLQVVSPSRAADLLALAFTTCAADAISQDFRLRYAAAALLAACKQALETAETGRAFNWDALTAAVEQAETQPLPQ
jgi:hypothetical protein